MKSGIPKIFGLHRGDEKDLEKLPLRQAVRYVLGSALWTGYALNDTGIARRLGIRNSPHHAGLRCIIRMTETFKAKAALPGLIDYFETKIGDVPCRVYHPHELDSSKPQPTIVYIHGGGWCFGSPASYHTFILKLSKNLKNAVVIVVDYRLAPENPFPAPLDDCLAVVKALYESGGKLNEYRDDFRVDIRQLILAGDSAGANLSTCLALELIREQYQHRPTALLLISPCFQALTTAYKSVSKYAPHYWSESGLGFWLASYAGVVPSREIYKRINSEKHLQPGDLKKWWSYVMPLEDDLFNSSIHNFYKDVSDEPSSEKVAKELAKIRELTVNPRAWPLLAENHELAQLPPLMMQTSSHDSLESESLSFYERLKQSGTKGVEHCYLNRADHVETIQYDLYRSKSGRLGFESAIQFLQSYLFNETTGI